MQNYFKSWWEAFFTNTITEEALAGKLKFTHEQRSLSLESQSIILGYVTALLVKCYPQDKVTEIISTFTGLKPEFAKKFFQGYLEKGIVFEPKSFEEFTADNHKIYNFGKTFSNTWLYGEKAPATVNIPALMHESDKKGVDEIKQIPMLEGMINTFHEMYDDKIIKVENLGKYIHVTPKQYPDLYFLLKETCAILGLKKEPDLYLSLGGLNAYTTSISDPCIVLSSGVLQLCNRDEIMFILGHEIGHIMSEHLLYTQMSGVIPKILAGLGKFTMGITTLMGVGIELKFRNWSRCAEFTADRFGYLACQNMGACVTTLLKLSGAPPQMIGQLDVTEYLKQYDEYMSFHNSGLNKTASFMGKLDETHPYSILRVKHLVDFAKSQEVQKKIAA